MSREYKILSVLVALIVFCLSMIYFSVFNSNTVNVVLFIVATLLLAGAMTYLTGDLPVPDSSDPTEKQLRNLKEELTRLNSNLKELDRKFGEKES